MNDNRTAEAPAAADATLGGRALLQRLTHTAYHAPALAATAAAMALQQQQHRARRAGGGQGPPPAPAHLPPGWQKCAPGGFLSPLRTGGVSCCVPQDGRQHRSWSLAGRVSVPSPRGLVADGALHRTACCAWASTTAGEAGRRRAGAPARARAPAARLAEVRPG